MATVCIGQPTAPATTQVTTQVTTPVEINTHESQFWSELVRGAVKAADRSGLNIPSVIEALSTRRDSDAEYIVFEDHLDKYTYGVVARTSGDFVLMVRNPRDEPTDVTVEIGGQVFKTFTLGARESRLILDTPIPFRALSYHELRLNTKNPLTIVGMYLRDDLRAKMDAVTSWDLGSAYLYDGGMYTRPSPDAQETVILKHP